MIVIDEMKLNKIVSVIPKRNRDLFTDFGSRYDPQGDYSMNDIENLPENMQTVNFAPTLGDLANGVSQETKKGIVDILNDYSSKNPSKKDIINKAIESL